MTELGVSGHVEQHRPLEGVLHAALDKIARHARRRGKVRTAQSQPAANQVVACSFSPSALITFNTVANSGLPSAESAL